MGKLTGEERKLRQKLSKRYYKKDYKDLCGKRKEVIDNMIKLKKTPAKGVQ